MDHVAVREWLDEAFFAPDALESDDASSQAARAHIVECPECAAHAQALRRTALKLDLARGPSAEVRERVLETARRIGRSRQPAPVRQPWWRGGLAWQLAATVLVVGVLGVSVGAWWGGATRPESVEARRLADAVAMMRAAAMREDVTEKNAVTPGPIAPARELLGESWSCAMQPAPRPVSRWCHPRVTRSRSSPMPCRVCHRAATAATSSAPASARGSVPCSRPRACSSGRATWPIRSK